MTCCPNCNRRVHNHSYNIKCCNCLQKYHIKCITLNVDEQKRSLENKEIWICLKCNTENFPFNCIEEEIDFIEACQCTPQNELWTWNLIYNLFQSNEADYFIGSEFDPDLNLYCGQNIFSGFACNYHSAYSFNERMTSFCSDTMLSFSLCHINIRSSKANMADFENY